MANHDISSPLASCSSKPDVHSVTNPGTTRIACPLTSGGGPQQPIEHSNTTDVGLVGLLDGTGFLPFEGVPSPKSPSLTSSDVEETSASNFCCIDFSDDSNMPSIVDLASVGLSQSPCLDGNPPT